MGNHLQMAGLQPNLHTKFKPTATKWMTSSGGTRFGNLLAPNELHSHCGKRHIIGRKQRLRQILPSPVCDLCSGPWESTLHSVRDCTTARRIWKMGLPSYLLESFMTYDNPKDWIRANFDSSMMQTTGYRHWPYIFRQLVHEIWQWRNTCIFQNHQRVLAGVAGWIVNL